MSAGGTRAGQRASARRDSALAISLALALCGCGIAGESKPRLLDPNAALYRELAASPSAAPTGPARVRVYLVRDNSLVAVVRSVPSLADLSAVAQALLVGATKSESDAGLTSAAPRQVNSVTLGPGGVAVVDLPVAATGDQARSDETLGFAQLVLTLDDLPTVQAVRFTKDGSPLAVPRGDGSITDVPLTRRDYLDLL